MTIINPKSIAGITSITTASGADNLLTVHTNNTTERIRINNDGDVIVGSGITVSPDGDIFATGVTTATTFSGSGASLTNLPAANITGTLPAISGANLTNLDASDLASGTVPTARLGSGTASSSTFLRGDSTFAAVTSTTINTNADNRVITGSGTANTLNGEATLTFTNSGSDPILSISNSGNPQLRLTTTSTTDSCTIDFGDNDAVNQGRITYTNSSDAMLFYVNGTSSGERIKIYSDGRVNVSHQQSIGSGTFLHVEAPSSVSSGETIVMIEGDNAAAGARLNLKNNTSGTSGFSEVLGVDAGGQSTSAMRMYNLDQSNNYGEIAFATRDQAGVAPEDRMRISKDGNVSIYGNSATGGNYGSGGVSPALYVVSSSGRQVKIHNTASSTSSLQLTNAATGQGDDSGFQLAALSSGAAYIHNAESAQIYFATNGSIRATMSGTAEEMVMGAQDGFTDYSLGNGIFLAYATSGYSASKHVIKGIHANTSFSETGGGMFFLGARRQSTAAYTLAGWYSGDGSSSVTSDRQFRFNGDGNAYADASWNGGGADYAEFFEWLDGNTSDEDRKGISVVLDNGKIRAATGSDNTDNIIGVISAAPVVVGDSASERWKEKWITDDFGGVIEETYTITEWYDETEKKKVNYSTDLIPSDVTVGAGSSVLSTDENGNAFTRKKLNPSWDSTATYIPRKDRKEWDIVGLMGKLKVKSDQPIGTKWIKMREVSASVHEYLVR